MMPKYWSWMVGLILFALAAVMGTGRYADAGAIELSYANFFPPTHDQGKLGEEWGKEIEKRTQGKIKVTYYPGGALLKGPQIYDGVLKGIADVGMSALAYSRGIFTAMEAIDLPAGYADGKSATAIINDFYQKFQPKELANVKPMYFHAHGPGLLHSKVPISKMEDLKGLKIRATGFSAKVVEALGGVPVAMSQAEAYEALQKGVADATFTPIETLKGWKQAEVIKYTIECTSVGYTTGFFVVMNLDKWNSIPADLQKIISQVNQEWFVKHGEAWDKSDQEGKAFTLSKGNKIVPLSAEENARWAKASQTVFDAYIQDAGKKGLPGKAYVDFIKEAIKKR